MTAGLADRHGLDGDKPKRQRPSRAGTGLSAPCPGRCGDCGSEFDTAAQWERHAKRTGHRVWQIALDLTSQPEDV